MYLLTTPTQAQDFSKTFLPWRLRPVENTGRTGRTAQKKRTPTGTIRWPREGPLVLVKWINTREVAVCSTEHVAHSSGTAQLWWLHCGGTTHCFTTLWTLQRQTATSFTRTSPPVWGHSCGIQTTTILPPSVPRPIQGIKRPMEGEAVCFADRPGRTLMMWPSVLFWAETVAMWHKYKSHPEARVTSCDKKVQFFCARETFILLFVFCLLSEDLQILDFKYEANKHLVFCGGKGIKCWKI